MAIYSMVKNNTFNGIPLPDIVIMDSDGNVRCGSILAMKISREIIDMDYINSTPATDGFACLLNLKDIRAAL